MNEYLKIISASYFLESKMIPFKSFTPLIEKNIIKL